jgi:hypothetical protein
VVVQHDCRFGIGRGLEERLIITEESGLTDWSNSTRGEGILSSFFKGNVDAIFVLFNSWTVPKL